MIYYSPTYDPAVQPLLWKPATHKRCGQPSLSARSPTSEPQRERTISQLVDMLHSYNPTNMFASLRKGLRLNATDNMLVRAILELQRFQLHQS